jgi:hypothetical protein
MKNTLLANHEPSPPLKIRNQWARRDQNSSKTSEELSNIVLEICNDYLYNHGDKCFSVLSFLCLACTITFTLNEVEALIH